MRHLVLFALFGCSSPSRPAVESPPPAQHSAELTPAFAKVEGWLGDWHTSDGETHWLAADGAMYGVWFTRDTFTIHIVDDGEGSGPADGVLRFIAIDNGRSYAETRDLSDSELSAFSHIDGGKPRTRVTAPPLEAADRAFAANTHAMGVDGWVLAFEPHGGMMRKGARIEGDAIREQMAGLLSEGVLAWEPIASGTEFALGFTVGKATYTPAKPGDPSWASTYITIWRLQPDGTWKVLFDTGRAVNR